MAPFELNPKQIAHRGNFRMRFGEDVRNKYGILIQVDGCSEVRHSNLPLKNTI